MRRFTAKYTYLDHLQNARRQLVARANLAFLGGEALVELGALILQLLGGTFELRLCFLVLQADLEPLLARQLVEIVQW